MCKISHQLKLCTCKAKNVEDLHHYWVLKRPNGEQNYLMGEAIMPVNIGEAAEKFNITTLAKMLNSGNCFDIELQHQANDILELHLTLNADNKNNAAYSYHINTLVYAFLFKRGKWVKTDFDPFGASLDDIQKGKITDPF